MLMHPQAIGERLWELAQTHGSEIAIRTLNFPDVIQIQDFKPNKSGHWILSGTGLNKRYSEIPLSHILAIGGRDEIEKLARLPGVLPM